MDYFDSKIQKIETSVKLAMSNKVEKPYFQFKIKSGNNIEKYFHVTYENKDPQQLLICSVFYFKKTAIVRTVCLSDLR